MDLKFCKFDHWFVLQIVRHVFLLNIWPNILQHRTSYFVNLIIIFSNYTSWFFTQHLKLYVIRCCFFHFSRTWGQSVGCSCDDFSIAHCRFIIERMVCVNIFRHPHAHLGNDNQFITLLNSYMGIFIHPCGVGERKTIHQKS